MPDLYINAASSELAAFGIADGVNSLVYLRKVSFCGSRARRTATCLLCEGSE